MAPAPHFDQLETRDPEQRELAQFNLLPDLIRQAVADAPGWTEHLKGIELSVFVVYRGVPEATVIDGSSLLRWLDAVNGLTRSPGGRPTGAEPRPKTSRCLDLRRTMP